MFSYFEGERLGLNIFHERFSLPGQLNSPFGAKNKKGIKQIKF